MTAVPPAAKRPWFRIRDVIAAVGAFVDDWVHSRSRSAGLLGLPAVLVLCASAGVVAYGQLEKDWELQQRYRTAAATALHAERLDEAELYYRKLAFLHESDPQAIYGLAVVADRRGDRDRARRLLRQLVKADHGQYAPAYLWLAQDLIVQHRRISPQTAAELERLLGHVVELDAENTEAHRLLGELFMAQRRFALAADHLSRVVDDHPQLRLPLARMYAVTGQRELARHQAQLAAEMYRSRVEADAGDVASRLRWAEALTFLESFPQAVAVLGAGKAAENKELSTALARVYVTWADFLARTEPGSLPKRLGLLERALAASPHDAAALVRLASIASQAGARRQHAIGLLRRLAAEATAPSVVHLILGTLLAESGDLETARIHLEQAYRHSPQTPAVLNNLAWVLAKADPPQLERALTLADWGVQLRPDSLSIRETRGQVLARLGRYQEAVADLERALPAVRDKAAVHRTLADAYRHLGDEALAEQHRRLAEQNEARHSASERPPVEPKADASSEPPLNADEGM